MPRETDRQKKHREHLEDDLKNMEAAVDKAAARTERAKDKSDAEKEREGGEL